ncbi:hypothetical protein ACFVIM_15895 [Streptomyces sp. NPDC057638]|uniref:hypothetical protein n=1 Tax=Streptomyces sp. NPDC057638 TaxID=3346190 RepID=UPI00369A4303
MRVTRVVGAALAVAALSLSLTACGGGGDGGDGAKNPDRNSTSAGAPRSPEQPAAEGTQDVSETGRTLATVNGSNGFRVTFREVERDSGGFLTLSGVIENISGKRQLPPVQWSGQETQVKRTGPSLGGITLVDKPGKKRYYVLRDTDGYPLTTTGLSAFAAGQSVDFFAQFPAPPEGTSAVDVQIPLMPTATIELS